MNWTVATYIAYLLVTIPLTVWVATTLSRNGRVFLADVFEGDGEMARAVNTLLVVGFYLVNLGFVVLFLRSDVVADLTGVFDALSVKVGIVLLVIGVLHFLNLWGFSSSRRRHRLDRVRAAQPAPVAAPAYPPYPTYPAR
jgi:hypothetical protein